MVKRITNDNECTMLIINKTEFQEEIQKRIDAGEVLIKRNINSLESLEDLRNDFSSWDDYNLELLKQSFNKLSNEYYESYDSAGSTGSAIFFVKKGYSPSIRNEHEIVIKEITAKINNLRNLIQKIDLLKSNVEDRANFTNHVNTGDKTQVFIVHGHDELAKTETARFIEKLGFTPIILHEQASAGQTIIEKIENYSNVGFGVVLYTPCDLGAKQGEEGNLKNRARQNVVFEHGYLIGKIGRPNVVALVKGDVETPNDISGVVYISMESGWELSLAKELKNSGYDVDMNKAI